MPASLDTCAMRCAAALDTRAGVADACARGADDPDRWGSVRTRLSAARAPAAPLAFSDQQVGWKPPASWSPAVTGAFDDPYAHAVRMVRYGHIDLPGWSLPLIFVSRRNRLAGAQGADTGTGRAGSTLPETSDLSGVLGGLMLAHRPDVPQLAHPGAGRSQRLRERRDGTDAASRWCARAGIRLPVGGSYAPEGRLWSGAPATARTGGIRYGHVPIGGRDGLRAQRPEKSA